MGERITKIRVPVGRTSIRVFAGLRLVFLLAAAVGVAALAADESGARTRSYTVMDYETGAILSAVNEDKQLHPASLTKMMTLYLVFEAIRDGRLSLDERVTVSRRAASMPPSRLGLRTGERVKLRHLIAAAAVRSANDAAVALAETVGGTEWEFAEMMTRKARSFGMSRTTFRNATGFTAKGHLSTARDMAVLGRRLLRDFPEHADTFGRHSIRWGGRLLRATNIRFLRAYKGSDGIKTGYTRAAGYTIVATAERDGKRLITSYFGASSSGRRANRVAELMNSGFDRPLPPDTLFAQSSPPPEARRLEPAASTLASAREEPAEPGDAPSDRDTPPSEPVADLVVEAAPVPAVAVSTPNAGNWAIQVGAYSRKSRAERHLRNVGRKHADIVAGADSKTPRRGRFYLAQFAGYGEDQARSACWTLRDRGLDCLAIRSFRTPKPAAPVVAQAAAATAPASGSWAVQVGAYARERHAQARLRDVSAKHGDLLGDASPTTTRPRRYYLARYAGLSEAGARSACDRLRGRGVDCLPAEDSAARTETAPVPAVAAILSGPAGRWSVQVGAYSRRGQAESRLRSVLERNADLIGTAEPRTPRPGRYYLAQFAGFGEEGARSACSRLRKRDVDCLPVAPSATRQRAAVAAVAETALRTPSTGWSVQVGAYSRKSRAEDHLRNIQTAHADVAGRATPVTPKRNRYYVARLAGFDEADARNACRTLAERGVECLPIAPPRGRSADSERAPVVLASLPGAEAPDPGAWAIQVGAHARKEQAEAHLHNVNAAHSDVTGKAVPATPRRDRWYLARFAGFDRGEAHSSCAVLRERGIDCLPVAFADSVTAAPEPKSDPAPAAEAIAAPGEPGAWSVQVGAYSRARQARAQIDRMRQRDLPALSGREFRVVRSGRNYLARFTGFEEEAARAACGDLKEKRIDCLAIRSGKAENRSSNLAETGWIVQVGAFRRSRDARRHLQRVQGAGFEQLEEGSGLVRQSGRYHLVQFESFTAQDADAACNALLRQGIDCMAIAPKKTSDAGRARSDWAIQVGAYSRASQARAHLNRVMARSIEELESARVWIPREGRLYLARLRNLDRPNANAACDALRSDGLDCLALAPKRN